MQSRSNTLQTSHFCVFWALIGLIFISVFLYGYFVVTTIWHTAERQDVEDNIIEKKTMISQLEIEIIDSNRNITKEYAYNIGFSPVNELVFVERSSITNLSLNEI